MRIVLHLQEAEASAVGQTLNSVAMLHAKAATEADEGVRYALEAYSNAVSALVVGAQDSIAHLTSGASPSGRSQSNLLAWPVLGMLPLLAALNNQGVALSPSRGLPGGPVEEVEAQLRFERLTGSTSNSRRCMAAARQLHEAAGAESAAGAGRIVAAVEQVRLCRTQLGGGPPNLEVLRTCLLDIYLRT